MVIQKWRPCFKTMCHRCTIHLNQQVIWQITHRVHTQQLIKQVLCCRFFEPVDQEVKRVIALYGGSEFGRIEVILFLRAKKTDPPEIGMAKGLAKSFESVFYPCQQGAPYRQFPDNIRYALLRRYTAQSIHCTIECRNVIPRIAGKQFISPISVQNHCDKLSA